MLVLDIHSLFHHRREFQVNFPQSPPSAGTLSVVNLYLTGFCSFFAPLLDVCFHRHCIVQVLDEVPNVAQPDDDKLPGVHFKMHEDVDVSTCGIAKIKWNVAFWKHVAPMFWKPLFQEVDD